MSETIKTPSKLRQARWLLVFAGLGIIPVVGLWPKSSAERDFTITFAGSSAGSGQDYLRYVCSNRTSRFFNYEVKTSKGTIIQNTQALFIGDKPPKNLLQAPISLFVIIPQPTVDSESLTFCWRKYNLKKYYQLRLRGYFLDHNLPTIAGIFPGTVGSGDVDEHCVPLPW